MPSSFDSSSALHICGLQAGNRKTMSSAAPIFMQETEKYAEQILNVIIHHIPITPKFIHAPTCLGATRVAIFPFIHTKVDVANRLR
jgi:hypothetical protein